MATYSSCSRAASTIRSYRCGSRTARAISCSSVAPAAGSAAGPLVGDRQVLVGDRQVTVVNRRGSLRRLGQIHLQFGIDVGFVVGDDDLDALERQVVVHPGVGDDPGDPTAQPGVRQPDRPVAGRHRGPRATIAGRHIELLGGNLPPGARLDDLDATTVANDLQLRTDREVPDADQRRLDAAQFVVVHDAPIAGVVEVLGGVEVADDLPAVVRRIAGLHPHHPAHQPTAVQHGLGRQSCAGLRDELTVGHR